MKKSRLAKTGAANAPTSRPEAWWNATISIVAVVLVIAFAALILDAPATQAQTIQVLYTFTGGTDGAYPDATVTFDRAGNLYGTTYGHNSEGGVYELQKYGSSWVFKSLYNFQPENDGSGPQAPVVFGPDGTLYGTTMYGGNECYSSGCGTVFNLQPPARICSRVECPWTEHQLYWFRGSGEMNDGYHPGSGPLVFDSAGNLYGTTADGGTTGNGTVYQLAHSQGSWTENILGNFPGDGGLAQPEAGVTLNAGNLFGTTLGDNYGGAYELMSTSQGWVLQTLHTFMGGDDGSDPKPGLIFDAAGNAYGATTGIGGQPATVFELTPQSDGSWTETILHVFTPGDVGPENNLAMDAAGNLYGTTAGIGGGGDRFGRVFKLSYANGSWTFTDLYDFTDGPAGLYPTGGVILDAAGNIYGTCPEGGTYNYGTVWELTP
jgi:uncharacterized repeat protein (TIGR03803 family)